MRATCPTNIIMLCLIITTSIGKEQAYQIRISSVCCFHMPPVPDPSQTELISPELRSHTNPFCTFLFNMKNQVSRPFKIKKNIYSFIDFNIYFCTADEKAEYSEQ